MMKKLLIYLCLLLPSAGIIAQSATVLEFSENANGYNLYLYQSVIRMLNKDKNPDFNMLIRNLDHLRFVTTPLGGDVTEAKSTLKGLDQGVESEGFENIMSVDNPNYVVHLYLSEQSNKSLWIATFLMDGIAGAMEMKGDLDTKYLHAFNSLNIERLQQMLPLGEDGELKEADYNEDWD